MKKIVLCLVALLMTSMVMSQPFKCNQVEKISVRPFDRGLNVGIDPVNFSGPGNANKVPDNMMSLLKIPMSSSLNANGIFVYEQRFVSIQQQANMFAYGNRAGGSFGNTGNDLKYKFTTDEGSTWDSVVLVAANGKNYRYPSMVVYNSGTTANPDEIYGVFAGPIYETSWTNQFFGSVRLDGSNEDVNFVANEPTVYLNHLHIGLYCSPDGHATVASFRLNGATGAYTYHGWEILNGSFNGEEHKFDWQVPLLKVQPALKEEGRIDASCLVWSPGGEIGYLFGTAVDSSEIYNPYGVEWPVIYKSTDHGLTWIKEPPFNFASIPLFRNYLYSTNSDTNLVIPRWYNKWASTSNQSTNGAAVDIHGNLHIFGLIRSTVSIHPDSLNYFATGETNRLFDVYMKPGGGWDAFYIDSLTTVNPPDPGTYGISWDHQTQMTRTADGSKVFCLWTDTDPAFSTENLTPDIKGCGYNAVTGMATPVKNFTAQTEYWLENWWMRVADEVFYDEITGSSKLPVTTSTLASTSDDPMDHSYFTGLAINDSEFSILVNTPEISDPGNRRPEFSICPNPFKGTTTVNVELETPANMVIHITNITGQEVMTINKGMVGKGSHKIRIDAGRLLPGVYCCTVTVGGISVTSKMVAL